MTLGFKQSVYPAGNGEEPSALYGLVLIIGLLFAHASVAVECGPWEKTHYNPGGAFLRGVVYGGDQFVAVGEAGTVLTSPNGIEWTAHSAGTHTTLDDITWGNGRFLTVDNQGTVRISLDGIQWTPSSSVALPNTGIDFERRVSVGWGEDLFVAVGSGMAASVDGTSWTTVGQGLAPHDVCHRAEQFVTVGPSYADWWPLLPSAIWTSADGLTWSDKLLLSGGEMDLWLFGVACGQDLLVAVGFQTTPYCFDCLCCTKPVPPAHSNSVIFRSSDGLTWDEASITIQSLLFDVVAGPEGDFVAVGTDGAILSSTDGEKWRADESGTEEALYDVIWGGGQFIAVGANETILRRQCQAEEPTTSEADVWVSLSDHPDPVPLYGDLTYDVYVANTGPDTASAVTL